MTSDNFIYIGSKPFMNYVTSVVIQFTTKEALEVLVRARGQFITRAVDVAQVACNRFLKDHVRVKDVSIGSEEFTNAEGKDVRVSTIDIILAKT
jgi:archaea-specific DNA-binding protein